MQNTSDKVDFMTSNVVLRDVTDDDLSIFFYQQLDLDASQMAGFPSRTQGAFMAHWAKIRADPTLVKQTILLDGQVAGNIVSWEQFGEHQIGYWIGKSYWGQGVATQALAAFLTQIRDRPLYAHVVKHNIASLRVLEKCGFVRSGANDEEILLKLSAHDTPKKI